MAPDPGKMERELRLATHQQRARGKDDVSLNKLPQMKTARSHMNQDHFPTPADLEEEYGGPQHPKIISVKID